MSESNLNAVMYHYVRDFQNTRYPGIKGLDVKAFERQLDFILKNFDVLSFDSLRQALFGEVNFERPSVVLTFDDGLKDHIEFVAPILMDRGVKGLFFPPSQPILEGRLLVVQAIQFVLSEIDDARNLLPFVLEQMREHLGADHAAVLVGEANASRFDTQEVMIVKRLLQRDLPREQAESIASDLFRRFVSNDERAFVEETYLSFEDVCELKLNGMHIGSHTHSHPWLSRLSREEQQHELLASRSFLEAVGVNTLEGWSLAYPYGDFNNDTLDVAKDLGCSLAFTTKVGSISFGSSSLKLSRWDTVDFPS